jgi:hypothetical protein
LHPARRRLWGHATSAIALSLLLVLAASTAFAPDHQATQGDMKKSMKKAGEGMKKFGKQVGEAGKEVGGEIADASKKVWFKGKQVSVKLLAQAQGATRRWWKEVIEKKDDSLRELRDENEKLKRELEKEGEP